MNLKVSIALFLAACTQTTLEDPSAATLPTAQAPLPQPITFGTFPFESPAAGELIVIQASGGEPGAIAAMFHSQAPAGPGLCPGYLGGDCLDIMPDGNGINFALLPRFDANGEILVHTTVPAGLPDGLRSLQIVSRLASGDVVGSNPVTHTFLPAADDCASGGTSEPNDSAAMAYAASPGDVISGNRVCEQDRTDWYAVDVPAGGTVTATITFDSLVADIDMVLRDSPTTNHPTPARLYDGALDSSENVIGTETVTYTSAEGGTYYVVPYLYLGDGSLNPGEYEITFDVTDPCDGASPFAELLPHTTYDGTQADVIDLGSFDFAAATDFTFVGQVKAIDLFNFGRIFDFGPDNANNFRFHHNVGALGRVAAGSFTHVLDVPDYWEWDVWLDVAVQYTAATNELRLFKNGAVEGTLGGVTIPAGIRSNLLLGGSNWGGFPSFEPPSIMESQNFQFFFEELSPECMDGLLSAPTP